ncbi:MAG: glycoside hydrolase family 43 protein [Planctomycetota bacterium]|nr:glycoside hydrolase family 43 protein [Planctomycetota bacterium]
MSGNPVFPGWYADPEIRVFGGLYWIFPTSSRSYDEQTYLDAFSSPDLTDWTRHERVLDTTRVAWAKRAMWAPSAVLHGDRYYLFFSANDIQSNEQVGGIGVGVSDQPGGPYRDLLGKPLIDAFHNGAQPIDQFAFQDADGRWYLYYGGWGRCNVVRLRDDFTCLEPLADGTVFKEITPKGYVEGAFMLLRGGKYYFMWSEGGWTGPDYAVAYGIGDGPTGPFERIGRIIEQDPSVARGAGHHSVLRLAGEGAEEYVIAYHRRPLGDDARDHRVVCLEKLEFDERGHIKPVRLTFQGVPARPADSGR